LTIHALRALRSVEPVLRMVVAVDERNAPARRLYDSLGFVEFECNQVLLYFW
jgi:ribosomal protein S18 acetylase RimI-like enzyme